MRRVHAAFAVIAKVHAIPSEREMGIQEAVHDSEVQAEGDEIRNQEEIRRLSVES